MKKRPSFIPYNQDQITFLPPSLEGLIPENHVVRVVNRAIDNINLSGLMSKYDGGGRSSYNPVMMLKIIIYAYIAEYGDRNLEELGTGRKINSEAIKAASERINDKLEKEPKNRKRYFLKDGATQRPTKTRRSCG